MILHKVIMCFSKNQLTKRKLILKNLWIAHKPTLSIPNEIFINQQKNSLSLHREIELFVQFLFKV